MSKDKTNANNHGKQFLSGVTVLAVSTVIVKVIGLFYKIPMMKYLGAEGMGYFNSAYEIYSFFFLLSTSGIPVAISILVSENHVQGKLKNINKIFNISLLLLSSLGLVGTLLMSIFYNEFALLISNEGAAYSIIAISPTILLICIASAVRGYFQGHQFMLPTAVSQVIEALGKLFLGLGLAIIALKYGLDMPKVAAAAVLGLSIGVFISMVYLVIRKMLYKKTPYSLNLTDLTERSSTIAKNILNIAIPITLSSTILGLTKIIDMTMILGRLGDIGYSQSAANSIYGSYSTMAVSIYNLPATLVTALALPLVPLLVSAIENKTTSKEKAIISSSFKFTALISIPAGLGIAVFSKQILELLFASHREEIEYTAPLLSILGISVFLSSMITITNAILQAYKQVKKPLISMIIGTIVKVVSAYILIGTPDINVYGAPISTFISTLVIVTLNLYFIVKVSGHIKNIVGIFVKPFVSSFVAIAVGTGIYAILLNISSSRINLIIAIALVILVYAICIFKLKTIDQQEVLMLPKGERICRILKKLKFL